MMDGERAHVIYDRTALPPYCLFHRNVISDGQEINAAVDKGMNIHIFGLCIG